jgi:hypothetical protein
VLGSQTVEKTSLMARVAGIARAKDVKPYYDTLAPDLSPVIINSRMPMKQQREALKALRERKTRIVICVNMLVTVQVLACVS